ncbi:hypothetical protein U713_01430 [Rhodobacter capsulatus YW2]|nr:hypothetical protein U713_01430 [Rhodobacter capsulatus YW2]
MRCFFFSICFRLSVIAVLMGKFMICRLINFPIYR